MGKPRPLAPPASRGLTNEQKLMARRLFKLRAHEAKGMDFQRLFEKVMGYRFPKDFIPIKPYGSVGDRKNDGYCPSSGTYHQVFAPEQPTAKQTVTAAIKKAQVDFAGLKRAWNKTTPINTFKFVFNDEYMGCPPDVALVCTALGKKHGIQASPYLAMHLEDDALQLDPDQLMDVIQFPIPQIDLLPSVDFSVLREVIIHVLDNRKPASRQAILKAPDLTEKIEFNGLTTPVGHLLHTAGRQSEAVTEYFARNSTNGRQMLRDKLNGMYLQSKQKFSSKKGKPEFADLVFFDLLEQMIPDDVKKGPSEPVAQDAALVVMAFYFEACDVFEAPDATS